MKTVRMLGREQVEVIEIPEPEPKDDMVVVKILSSTLCGTEYHAYHAPDAVDISHANAGHEAAGIVWKTDRARRVKEGDRVTIFPSIFKRCGRCPECLSGNWLLCHSPSPAPPTIGTHSQFVLQDEDLCFPIPEDIPFDTGAMIDDCLGTPYRAIKRLGVGARDTVLVTGVGPIGAAATIITKMLGARIIVADINKLRLEHALQNGADCAVNPQSDDLLTKVREFAGIRGVDVAIDCSGMEQARVQCLDAVRPGGRVAFLGIKSESTTVDVTQHFILKELTAIGSWALAPSEHSEVVKKKSGKLLPINLSLQSLNALGYQVFHFLPGAGYHADRLLLGGRQNIRCLVLLLIPNTCQHIIFHIYTYRGHSSLTDI